MAHTLTAWIPEIHLGEVIYQFYTQIPLVARFYKRWNFGEPGEPLSIPVPDESITTNNMATAGIVTKQDLTPSKIQINPDHWREVTYSLSDVERAKTYPEAFDTHIKPAANAMAKFFEDTCWALYSDIANFHKAPVSVDSLADIADALEKLNNNGIPTGEELFMVLDAKSNSSLLKLDALVNVDKAGTPLALRAGLLGDLLGFNVAWGHRCVTHTNGTHGAGPHSASGVNALGATTLNMAGFGLSVTGAVKNGDNFTLGGYDYVITADGNSDGSGVVAASIYPALKVATTGGETVTFCGASAESYKVGLAFPRPALALGMRYLEPEEATQATMPTDEGMVFRIDKYYDNDRKSKVASIDANFGVKVVNAEWVCRINMPAA